MKRLWEDFLNPDVLRPRLITASLFIAGFELLKDSILGRIRDFYCRGFNEKGDIMDPTYRAEILRHKKGPLYASLDWLRETGAIDDADIDAFNHVKDCRNQVVHRLYVLAGTEGLPADFDRCFQEMAVLLLKIEVWWIKNFEIPANPDLDGKDIDQAEIVPGAVLGLQLLCDIALGSDEQSRSYYEALRQRTSQDRI